MNFREQTEARESDFLSPYAVLSAACRGRVQPEEPDSVRTEFQRDRDRLIHVCQAFRRLAHKTQVFIATTQDHFRTRLSHTLEVSQIARTVAKALRLNEDLVEAISLGHDVGHTPFGHAGEDALDLVYREYDPQARFAHHEHSLRVVDCLEREGRGLNLSYETREGILAHSKSMTDLAYDLAHTKPPSLEAMVVRLSDRIAYVNHDLDDSLHAGLLTREQVPREITDVLGLRHGQRVARMVEDLIAHSQEAPRLQMSAEVLEATDALKNFLVERIYQAEWMQREASKARSIVTTLFHIYMRESDSLAGSDFAANTAEERARLVADYVAGMTDRFACERYLQYMLPAGAASYGAE
ncbi:MAG TPA: deoxyguanosinetriphosphate triphosphohydrolase [Armatimonadota bacterium]|jgi:dGTPase